MTRVSFLRQLLASRSWPHHSPLKSLVPCVTQRVAKSERWNYEVGVNSVVGVASGTGFGTIVDGNNALCQEQLVLKPVVASAH